jgi:hypothetical protein
MDNFEAYSPPRAVVTNVQPEQAKIPLLFKILLITYLVLCLLGSLMSLSWSGIVWSGVMAFASWKTLGGSRPASRVLGALLVLTGVLAILAAVFMFVFLWDPRDSVRASVVMLVLAVYVLALAGFIYIHPAMQAAFRKSDAKKWSGG